MKVNKIEFSASRSLRPEPLAERDPLASLETPASVFLAAVPWAGPRVRVETDTALAVLAWL